MVRNGWVSNGIHIFQRSSYMVSCIVPWTLFLPEKPLLFCQLPFFLVGHPPFLRKSTYNWIRQEKLFPQRPNFPKTIFLRNSEEDGRNYWKFLAKIYSLSVPTWFRKGSVFWGQTRQPLFLFDQRYNGFSSQDVTLAKCFTLSGFKVIFSKSEVTNFANAST